MAVSSVASHAGQSSGGHVQHKPPRKECDDKASMFLAKADHVRLTPQQREKSIFC